MRTKNTLFILFLLLFSWSCSSTKIEVDSIVIAPKIYIGNETFDVAEAMAIADGKIVEYGTASEIKQKYHGAINEEQGTIYPGFIDAHSHFYGYGMTLNKVNLLGVSSMEELVDRVAEFAKTNTEPWITGRGWDQTTWETQGTLTHNRLNAYFPNVPVFVKRIDGHAGLANSKALELAGITPNTKVAGGTIEVQNGQLTGILTDNAMNLIDQIIPKPSRATEIKALLMAQEQCFKAGLTTVTDAGLDLNTILLIDSLQKTGDLSIRIYAMCNPTEENFVYFEKNGALSKDNLQVSSFKLYADGALGSRGAKLKQPYCDHADHTGVWVTEPSELATLYQKVYDLGFQANTHCIGDSANRLVLESYGSILKGTNDKRWRIEHAQVVSPADRLLFKQYSIIPSVQPTHATSDMRWAEQRLCAQRMSGAYAYRSLLAIHGWLPLGTDFPVEDISPLKTFYAAVYRQDSKSLPIEGYRTQEAISAKEALLGMTSWAAKASRMENKVGSLEKGKWADYIVLNDDIYTERYMLKTKVLATYQNGKKR
jgi:predicted amidohydrolase YtcJ